MCAEKNINNTTNTPATLFQIPPNISVDDVGMLLARWEAASTSAVEAAEKWKAGRAATLRKNMEEWELKLFPSFHFRFLLHLHPSRPLLATLLTPDFSSFSFPLDSLPLSLDYCVFSTVILLLYGAVWREERECEGWEWKRRKIMMKIEEQIFLWNSRRASFCRFNAALFSALLHRSEIHENFTKSQISSRLLWNFVHRKSSKVSNRMRTYRDCGRQLEFSINHSKICC